MLKRFIICLLACMFLQVVAMADSLSGHQDGFDYVLTEEGAIVTGWDNWSDEEVQPVLCLPSTLGGGSLWLELPRLPWKPPGMGHVL